MAQKIPPAPVGTLPGSSYWNDWYEKIRTLINSGTISQLWSSIDFTASNITDIVTRAHNNLQSFQGGTAGEYYHLTSAQNTTVGTLASGTYTPTLTNVANLDASTAYEAQYMRVGSVVTVSGRVDIDPTLAATSTQLGISLPIASNLGATEDCAGTAFCTAVAGMGAAILGDAANNRAQLQYISSDINNQPMYYTFTYGVI